MFKLKTVEDFDLIDSHLYFLNQSLDSDLIRILNSVSDDFQFLKSKISSNSLLLHITDLLHPSLISSDHL